MPYNTVVVFVAFDPLAAADLNNNFANLDYLNAKINAQIQIDAASLLPRLSLGATPGHFATSGNAWNYATMDFPDGSLTHADFKFVLPSDYNGGTMTAIFYWTANSTSTNSVVWQIVMGAMADDEALDHSVPTAQTVTDANKSSAYDVNVTSATSAITISGTPAAGELCHGTVYRDASHASDNLAATASLIAVVLTYTRS